MILYLPSCCTVCSGDENANRNAKSNDSNGKFVKKLSENHKNNKEDERKNRATPAISN